MSDANKKQHKYESATWDEIEGFLRDYEKWYATRSESDEDSGGQPTPPPPPPPGSGS